MVGAIALGDSPALGPADALAGGIVVGALVFGEPVAQWAVDTFGADSDSNTWMVEGEGKETPTKPTKMQQEVKRKQAPKGVKRVDRPHVPGQQPHVHYNDGTSSNMDGSIHDKHRGTPSPSKKVRDWLDKHNWKQPSP